jgi:hypothetical protein
MSHICSAGPDVYEVTIEKGVFNHYLFPTELQLSLRAPKAIVDSFLEQHPDLVTAADRISNGIAVVGKVGRISAAEYRDREGERVEMKVGHGDLLGIVHTGDVFRMK